MAAIVAYIRNYTSNTTIALLSDHRAQVRSVIDSLSVKCNVGSCLDLTVSPNVFFFVCQGDAIFQRVKHHRAVSTFPVEEFHQQEADIVIVCCTRSVPRSNKAVGFEEDRLLTHMPTLHLALSRAKYVFSFLVYIAFHSEFCVVSETIEIFCLCRQYVIILGKADVVVSYGEHWSRLLDLTKSEGSFKTVCLEAPSNDGVMQCVGVTKADLPKSPRSPPDGQPPEDSEMGNGDAEEGPRKKARTT